MPVFEAHATARRYTSVQKRALADALNQSLVLGPGIPEGDGFIMIGEQNEDELFLRPSFMGMERSDDAMLRTVFVGAHRPLEDKQTLAAHINKLAVEALSTSTIRTTRFPICGEQRQGWARQSSIPDARGCSTPMRVLLRIRLTSNRNPD